ELADAERLAETRQRLQLALTHMGQGLALFGANGDVLLHNQRMVDLLNLPQGTDLVGQTLRDICARVMLATDTQAGSTPEAIDQMQQRHARLAQTGGEIVHGLGSEMFLRIQHTPTGDGGWVTMIEDISDSKRSEAAISHLAKHDPLTGLPNRSRFEEMFTTALEQSDADGHQLAVIA